MKTKNICNNNMPTIHELATGHWRLLPFEILVVEPVWEPEDRFPRGVDVVGQIKVIMPVSMS